MFKKAFLILILLLPVQVSAETVYEDVDGGIFLHLDDDLSLANSQFKPKRAVRKGLGNVFAIQSQLH